MDGARKFQTDFSESITIVMNFPFACSSIPIPDTVQFAEAHRERLTCHLC